MNAALRALAMVTGALCMAATLAGCAARSVEHFYTVSETHPVSTSGDAPRIAVAPVSIPPLIDRPQLVVRDSRHELRVLENHRWAEPLSIDLTRALMDALRQTTGGADVVERDAARARTAPLVLEVTITQLIAGPGPSTSLQASWVLRDRQRICAKSWVFGADIPMQSGYEAIPAAYALAMSRLAETISQTVVQSMSCADLARAQRGEG